MKHSYTRLLADAELKAHLEKGDTVILERNVKPWQEIEQQVDRLGFGDTYAVSRTQHASPSGAHSVTRVSPLRQC